MSWALDRTGLPTQRLREVPRFQAQSGSTTIGRQLAYWLQLEPPLAIHRLTAALEVLMLEDVAAGRPLLAALSASQMWPGVAGRGFFLMAHALGVFSGDPAGPRAYHFHAGELHRVRSFYSGATTAVGDGVRRDFKCYARDRS